MTAAVSNHRAASEPLSFRSVRSAPALSIVAGLDTIKHATPASSSGDISPVWNTAAFRRSFPHLWAEYLRDRYRTAYGVQKAFPGIDSKTARDWIGGKRDPHGSFVAAAIKHDIAALEILGRIE